MAGSAVPQREAGEVVSDAVKPREGSRINFVGMKSDGRMHMSREQEVVAQAELNRMLLDWDFYNSGEASQRQMLVERLGWPMGAHTFRRLKKAVPWEELKATYRKAACMFAPAIDMALIKKAVRGDTKAIELFYTRMEGWTPRTGLDVTAGAGGDVRRLDTKELLGQLMGGMTEGERRALLERGELPEALGRAPGEGEGDGDGPRSDS
jgi:hypothetical protein